MISEEKRIVRGQIRARLAAITREARALLSPDAVELLLAQPEWFRASTLMGYLAMPDELDISEAFQAALAQRKTVALPRYLSEKGVYGAAQFLGETLGKGKFGVSEPAANAAEIPLKRLDLVLVPGVAFDGFGRRLGRGKGFYDRLLAEVGGVKCGVALDEQIVERLPFEVHDISMDFILTPTRWIDVRAAGKR